MKYPEAMAYLESALRFGIKPGLERIKELLRRLGQPQERSKTFHIAGTNGKGSVSSYLTHILAAGGWRVGWFTSPYLERFTERIRIISGLEGIAEYAKTEQAGEIDKDDFAQLMSKISHAVEGMLRDGFEHPTEFELITAAALLWFQQTACDYVVLETGLGGRLDSTNIIERPLATIITSLGYDHQDRLGSTIEKIVSEKAGIFKAGVPVLAYDPAASYLSTDDQQSVRQALERHAAQLSCPLTWLGRPRSQAPDNYVVVETISYDLCGQDFIVEGESFSTCLLGSYQPLHAGLAITAARPYVDTAALKTGVKNAVWPGRLEILSRKDPFVLLDGAHNPQGSAALAETLERIIPQQQVIFLIGVLGDKDHKEMLTQVLTNRKYRLATIIVTEPPNPRRLEAEVLASEIETVIRNSVEAKTKDGYNICVTAIADAAEASREAVRLARQSGLPLIAFGSLYLAGAIRKDLRGNGHEIKD